MKASRKNRFTDQASGSSGNMTFSTRKSGKTVIGGRRGPSSVPLSEAQVKTLDRFKTAIAYGRTAMADPERKAMYEGAVGHDQSAYIIAVRDYYRVPKVVSIDFVTYNGNVGDTIRVIALDDFKVVKLNVAILNAAGETIESGNAVVHTNGVDWVYTATVVNAQLTGTRIVATAYDLPDNRGSLEMLVR